MSPALKVGESGDKRSSRAQFMTYLEPVSNTQVLALTPTYNPPSIPMKTYWFDVPFPSNPYYPKDLSHHPCTEA